MRNIELGQTKIQIGNFHLKIFDRERTIVDSFRYLSREVAIKALQTYLRQKKPDLGKLMKYAKVLRVDIHPYIMALTTWTKHSNRRIPFSVYQVSKKNCQVRFHIHFTVYQVWSGELDPKNYFNNKKNSRMAGSDLAGRINFLILSPQADPVILLFFYCLMLALPATNILIE